MTEDQVREALAAETRGGLSKWAREHGLSPSYVSETISGMRRPGEKILVALDLERVVDYQPRSK